MYLVGHCVQTFIVAVLARWCQFPVTGALWQHQFTLVHSCTVAYKSGNNVNCDEYYKPWANWHHNLPSRPHITEYALPFDHSCLNFQLLSPTFGSMRVARILWRTPVNQHVLYVHIYIVQTIPLSYGWWKIISLLTYIVFTPTKTLVLSFYSHGNCGSASISCE